MVDTAHRNTGEPSIDEELVHGVEMYSRRGTGPEQTSDKSDGERKVLNVSKLGLLGGERENGRKIDSVGALEGS